MRIRSSQVLPVFSFSNVRIIVQSAFYTLSPKIIERISFFSPENFVETENGRDSSHPKNRALHTWWTTTEEERSDALDLAAAWMVTQRRIGAAPCEDSGRCGRQAQKCGGAPRGTAARRGELGLYRRQCRVSCTAQTKRTSTSWWSATSASNRRQGHRVSANETAH